MLSRLAAFAGRPAVLAGARLPDPQGAEARCQWCGPAPAR